MNSRVVRKEYTSRSEIISFLETVQVVVTNEDKTGYELQTRKIKGGRNRLKMKSGGNGLVVFAKDKESGLNVAMKFFVPNNPKWIKDYNRFRNEISLLRKSEHPRLIKCLGDGLIKVNEARIPFYIMPLAKGSMRDLLNKNKFDDFEFTYRFFEGLGSALKYLHEKGCFHRDLKPENVLLDENNLPLVADLGIAHINPEFASAWVHTQPQDKLHNREYYAPEQRYGGDATMVDHRADICSFGYLLQEALTGRYPLGSNAALPGTIIKPEYVVFDSIIMKCTKDETQIHNRYQSMAACLDDLETAFKGSLSAKKQLAAFYAACRKVNHLAWQWPIDGELLSAGTLRTLYLRRTEYSPSELEKTILFANLLLGGQGKYHGQRTSRADSAASHTNPMPLGWYWFRNMAHEEGLKRVRDTISHPNLFVSAGALRVLGRIGQEKD